MKRKKKILTKKGEGEDSYSISSFVEDFMSSHTSNFLLY